MSATQYQDHLNSMLDVLSTATEPPRTVLGVIRFLKEKNALPATDWATWISLIITILQVISEWLANRPQPPAGK